MKSAMTEILIILASVAYITLVVSSVVHLWKTSKGEYVSLASLIWYILISILVGWMVALVDLTEGIKFKK